MCHIALRADAAEGVPSEAGPQKRAGNSPSFVKGTGEDQIFSKPLKGHFGISDVLRKQCAQ